MQFGTFVSVDGPNGVGKSTLIKLVADLLTRKAFTVHCTKEVTASSLGQFIRNYHHEFRGKCLAFLLAADRQNHIETDVLPSLQTHDFVITDRYIDSSLVYQRLDGVELEFLWQLNRNFLRPDLSICVTASPGSISERLKERTGLDRFEKTFTRADEILRFDESATFLLEMGFNVFRLANDTAHLEAAVETLTREILRTRDRKAARF